MDEQPDPVDLAGTSMRAAAHELAERTAREQGLPRYITDPGVLARIAVILNGGSVTTSSSPKFATDVCKRAKT
jgi:hypothetical protein